MHWGRLSSGGVTATAKCHSARGLFRCWTCATCQAHAPLQRRPPPPPRAPVAFSPKHPWQQDLCHTPPNLCDAKGRLLSLALRDAGLKCGSFPKELGKLASLQRMDLSNNEFQANAQDVAAVGAAWGEAAQEVARATPRRCWSPGRRGGGDIVAEPFSRELQGIRRLRRAHCIELWYVDTSACAHK